MRGTIDFLLQNGYSILVAWIFAEQLGLPIPSMPLLLSAGALAGTGHMNLAAALLDVTLAAVTADLIWYWLGIRKGTSVLDFLCKISLEPDSCVRRTQSFYVKQGARSLVIAKFVPGLNTIAPPLAGIMRMKLGKFLFWDAMGSLLWAGAFLGAGFIFSGQIERIAEILAGLGGKLVTLLVAAIFGYMLYKYSVRRRLLKQLRTARITVDELKRMIDEGKEPVILDLRASHEFLADPEKIPGAILMETSELEKGRHRLPKDREIVLYCT